MNQLYAAALPIALMAICFVVPIYVLIWNRKQQRLNRRSPLTSKLLRGPGQALRSELERLGEDIDTYLVSLAFLPLLVFSSHVSQSYIGSVPESAYRLAVGGFFIVGGVIYLSIRLYRLARQRFFLRVGLEAEIAMGQELDQLMREGAVVFHDFVAEGFNIDHVVLTRGGMYAVETKGYMKPDRGGGKKDATVQFNGEVLTFPNWRSKKALVQARHQAEWLAKWLSSAVGEKVGVRPVIALPGWWVDRVGRGDVTVISGGEARSLMKGWQNQEFSDQMMKRIAHQLEQRCRDVEPTQYGRQVKFGQSVNDSKKVN